MASNCMMVISSQIITFNGRVRSTLVLRMRRGGELTYFVDDSLMDPKFDYDFTKKANDGKKVFQRWV